MLWGLHEIRHGKYLAWHIEHTIPGANASVILNTLRNERKTRDQNIILFTDKESPDWRIRSDCQVDLTVGKLSIVSQPWPVHDQGSPSL